MQIWGHSLVKNEESWLWYSTSSVVRYLDKILIWDTGSTDKTVEVIKLLQKKYKDNIVFRQYGEVDPLSFAKARQEMLDQTNSDWFMVIDGDEIWWDESIKKLVNTINTQGDKIESIVVPTVNFVGDIYHYQEEKAGKYRFGEKEGHLNLRAINRNIPGLKSLNPHGSWGWVDGEGKMIQDRNKEKVVFVNAPYLHTTFLQRGLLRNDDSKVPKRLKKYKYEIGIETKLDYFYPEVFFQETPNFIPSIWKPFDYKYKIRAMFETPLRKIYRRLLSKVGY
jgi:glycosyltransferase involved in cell wall biosynthesis